MVELVARSEVVVVRGLAVGPARGAGAGAGSGPGSATGTGDGSVYPMSVRPGAVGEVVGEGVGFWLAGEINDETPASEVVRVIDGGVVGREVTGDPGGESAGLEVVGAVGGGSVEDVGRPAGSEVVGTTDGEVVGSEVGFVAAGGTDGVVLRGAVASEVAGDLDNDAVESRLVPCGVCESINALFLRDTSAHMAAHIISASFSLSWTRSSTRVLGSWLGMAATFSITSRMKA